MKLTPVIIFIWLITGFPALSLSAGKISEDKTYNIIIIGEPNLKYEIWNPELPLFLGTFPASISRLPELDVENVSLGNILIIYSGRKNNGYAHLPLRHLNDVSENESQYPGFSMFRELLSWGFYVRHVKS